MDKDRRTALPSPQLGARRRLTGVPRTAELGGKGAVLDLLRRRGLPVPPGFVVPADVYRAAMRDSALLPVLRQLAAALESEQPPTPATIALSDPAVARGIAIGGSQVRAIGADRDDQ